MPGRIRIRSTRPSVRAVISIVFSGTSVPSPRTSRSIGPRRTVSGQSVDISTPGAAGFNFASPMVIPTPATANTTSVIASRIAFFLPTPLRCISILISGGWKGHGACQS